MARFRQRSPEVEARRLTKLEVIVTGNGAKLGKPGEWELKNDNGEKALIEDDKFRRMFEPMDEEARAALEAPKAEPEPTKS